MTEDNTRGNNSEAIADMSQNGYQVLISDITWNPNSSRPYYSKHDDAEKLPTQFAYDVPDGFLKNLLKKCPSSDDIAFKDAIETHCYDFLTRRFGHEVYSCSIWLPLENYTA